MIDGVARADFWSGAELEVLLSFVKERKGDEMAVIEQSDGAWLELEKEWQAKGKVKGFSMTRTARVLYAKHKR